MAVAREVVDFIIRLFVARYHEPRPEPAHATASRRPPSPARPFALLQTERPVFHPEVEYLRIDAACRRVAFMPHCLRGYYARTLSRYATMPRVAERLRHAITPDA